MPERIFIDHSFLYSGSIGYSHFNDRTDQTLNISPYVTDLFTNNHQHHHASYSLSAKQQLAVDASWLSKLFFGPALYFQQANYSGDVWEMVSPEFDNYDYRFKSTNVDVVFESELYFKPMIQHITPFVTVGVGFGVANMHYDDYALPRIPLNTEIHRWGSQTKAVYEIGAGLALPINAHWGLNLRYNYLQMGTGHIEQLYPLDITLNTNNVLLGFNYSL